MGQRKARPLWVDVARAPVDVTVAGLQTGFGLVSRMARTVTGSQTPPAQPPQQKRTLLKSMKSFRSVWKSTSELGYPEIYCRDLREPPRHRADAVP